MLCPKCDHELPRGERLCPKCLWVVAEAEPFFIEPEELPPSLEASDDYEFTKVFQSIKQSLKKAPEEPPILKVPPTSPILPSPSKEGPPKKEPEEESPKGEEREVLKKDLRDYNFEEALQKIKETILEEKAEKEKRAKAEGAKEKAFKPSSPSSKHHPTNRIELSAEFRDLATEFLKTTQCDKAIEYSQRALSMVPEDEKVQETLKVAQEKKQKVIEFRQKAQAYEILENYRLAYQEWLKVAELLPYEGEIQEKLTELSGKSDRMWEEGGPSTSESPESPTRIRFKKDGKETEPAISPKEELQKGRNYLKEGKFKKAKKCALRILQQDEDHQEAHQLLEIAVQKETILTKLKQEAQEHESHGEFTRALTKWKRVENLSPTDRGTLHQMLLLKKKMRDKVEGKMKQMDQYLKEGEHRQVIEMGEDVLKILPEDESCQNLIRRAQLALKTAQKFLRQATKYFQSQNWKKAGELAKDALDLDPKLQEARDIAEKARQQLELIQPAQFPTPLEEIGSHIQEVQNLIRKREFRKAIELVKQILALAPHRTEMLDLYEKLIIKEREHQEWMKKATRKSVDLTRKILSPCKDKGKDFQDSETTIQKALLRHLKKEDIDGSSDLRQRAEIEAILGLVDLLLEQGSPEMALEELKNGLQRYPQDPTLRSKLKGLQEI